MTGMCPQQGTHSGHLCQGSSVGLKQVSKSSNHIGASVNRPLLSSPRCWTHHQSQEGRGGPVPGPGTGCDRSPDRAVHALFSHASWSLRCGVSVLQVLQALQAAEHTTRPAGAEPSFFVLTTVPPPPVLRNKPSFFVHLYHPQNSRGSPIPPIPECFTKASCAVRCTCKDFSP